MATSVCVRGVRMCGVGLVISMAAAGSPTAQEAALSLREALAAALIHSPQLAAYAAEVRAREARIVQAGVAPNPVLELRAEDFGGSAATTSGEALVPPQTTVQLSQLIELGGKRAARRDLATREREVAAWDYEAARIDTLTLVTRMFLDVLAAQRAVTLSGETLRLAAETQQAVANRVTAGVVSPIEATRADVLLAASRLEGDRARRTLDAARVRLATVIGTPPSFGPLLGDLDALPAVPSFEELRSRLNQTPALARWITEIAQRQALVALEQSKRRPDLTLTGGYRRYAEIGSNAVVVGVSMPLPVFDKNRGAIAEAASRVAKAREEQRTAESVVMLALAESHRTLVIADAEVKALKAAIIPGAEETFAAISEGYRLGRFGYLDVLEAQRALLTYNAQLLTALAEFHKAVADVERLTGTRLDGVALLPPATVRED